MKRSTAALLAFAIFVYFAVHMSGVFYWPSFETGDDAANSLSIIRAKHFAQLYGCFSRWGFYHPGPAFFYVQGWGEWLFYDWLHLCPEPRNAQVLTQIGLNICFFVIALRTFVVWLPAGVRRVGFLAGALALACFHFAGERSGAFFSTWPAYPPILLMLCLLTVGAAVASGLGSELPLLVLAGGFLVHSHVAQPLFVVPLTLLSYAGLWWHCASHAPEGEGAAPLSIRRRAARWLAACWRAWPRAHVLAGGVLAIFLLPLLIDVCRGADSNLVAILHHMRSHHGEHKRWLRSVLYFIQFGTYATYQSARPDFGHYDRVGMLAFLRAHALILACWLGVTACVVWAVVRQIPAWLGKGAADAATPADEPLPTATDTRRFLAWAGVLWGVALGLTLYWGTIQDGPMLYYNAFFNYGIYYFAALIALASFCFWLPLRLSLQARSVPVAAYLVPACLVLIVYGGWNFPAQLKQRQSAAVVSPGTQLYQQISGLIAATSDAAPGRPPAPKFLLGSAEWPWLTAVALKLCRTGWPFLVPEQDGVIFGDEYAIHPDSAKLLQNGVQIWRVAGSPTPAGLPPLSPSVMLAPQVPLFLGVSAPVIDPGVAATIDFHLNGNAPTYALSGWSTSEPWGTWSDGFRALLALKPGRVDGGDVELQVRAFPLLYPVGGLNVQRLQVFFNGESLGSPRRFDTGTPAVATFIIPAGLWNQCASQPSDCAVLAFAFPDAGQPAKYDPTGRNQDQRHLAFGFQSLRFTVVRDAGGPTDAKAKP